MEQQSDCAECGLAISSTRQIEHPGTDLCDKCAEKEE